VSRKGKKAPDQNIYFAMASQWSHIEPMLKDPLVCALGYVDRKKFQQAMTLARNGHSVNLPKLLVTLSLELWLSSLYKCEQALVATEQRR